MPYLWKERLENFCDFIRLNFWSLNSSIIMWSAVEKASNHSADNTKAKLVTKIKEVFEDLSRDTVRNSYTKFWSSLLGRGGS